jgi:AcrR family transcriptional regulator
MRERPRMKPYGGSRRALLDAAARVFSREGLDAAGVSLLVKEAQVTITTFYKNFPSKDALIAAYVEEGLDRARRLVGAITADVTTQAGARTALLQLADLDLSDGRVSVFAVVLAGCTDANHPARVAVSDWMSWFAAAAVEPLFGAAGYDDSEKRANDFISLWWGAVVQHHVQDRGRTRRAFKRQALALEL